MRYFNIAGKCYPQKHYMVDLSQRAQKIRRMIDDGRLGHASMNTTQKTYLHIIQELESQDVDLVMRSLSSLC